MTLDEVLIRKQAKAAAEGSTAAFKALELARTRRGVTFEPEPPEVQEKRAELSARLMQILEAVARLKKEGLLADVKGLTLVPWIYEEQRRRSDAAAAAAIISTANKSDQGEPPTH